MLKRNRKDHFEEKEGLKNEKGKRKNQGVKAP